jgi:sugar O-acyltransferase (sialic acid O-acetyltransferase NeuD family)
MTGVVLFGIGSTLVAEYTETCQRLGYRIVAAVRNHPGPVHFRDAERIVSVGELAPALRDAACFCPIFTPRHRRAAAEEAAALGLRFPRALVDPTAIVASTAALGGGSFLNAGSIIGAEAVLAEHVVVNRAATVGHHTTLGAHVSLGPGVTVAGYVTVGSGVMIGAGAVVVPEVEIGPNAVIGAGAVVVADVPAGATVWGNPARVVETVS